MGYKTNPALIARWEAAIHPERKEADAYRAAVEKASYAQLGPRFTQGLNAIQGRLAGMGPLADSGAATALKARLASGIYNTATGQITGSYADMLRQQMLAAQQYRYQSQLLKQQKQQQKKDFWQTLLGTAGGAAGGYLAGGPPGAVAGGANAYAHSGPLQPGEDWTWYQ